MQKQLDSSFRLMEQIRASGGSSKTRRRRQR